jgi:hypothetical protein
MKSTTGEKKITFEMAFNSALTLVQDFIKQSKEEIK